MFRYDAEQKQRAMERQIRKERSKLAGLDTAIKSTEDEELKTSLKNDFDNLSVKLKSHEAKYKDFSYKTGLPPQKQRLQMYGFNRSVIQKAVHARKNLYNNAKAIISEKNMPKNIEEFSNICYNPTGDLLSELSNLTFENAKKINGMFNNKVVRAWYLAHDKKIPELIDSTLSIDQQAKQAFELRNTYKVNARDLMLDQKERKQLDIKEPIKAFEELVQHKKDKGLKGDEIYKDIISSSAKTRKSVNKKYGLEKE